ncbi:MAG TPA: hypothetical protein VF526_09050 [Solirubrobacteraceae bacterium]
MAAARFSFPTGVDLRLAGDRAARRHFAAEYAGAAAPDDGSVPSLEVRFVRTSPAGPRIEGGHKTARWSVLAPAAASGSLRAAIALRGRPRFFGLSLVQGYFVEPLLSIAVARAGAVLLPSAAIGEDGGALVIMGSSGTGKSSLSARALAAGRTVLGDDQILLDGDGCCWRFPRRMRFYSDLAQTAPAAYARLPPSARRQLQARKVAKVLSRGFVRPSFAIQATQIGARAPTGPLALRRVVLLERSDEATQLTEEPAAVHVAVAHGLELLAEQRARLGAGEDPGWPALLQGAAALERQTLSAALGEARVTRICVPRGWSAPLAIAAMAAHLGTER